MTAASHRNQNPDTSADRPDRVRLDRYRPDIDGLRAIAILSVIAFHARLGFAPGGFTGVDIFFVISGYLIGRHILHEMEARTFRFATFYARRAKRILPAFYAVLSATLVLGAILFSPVEFRALCKDAAAATVSLSNVAFWRHANYFATSSDLNPVLMTWSLGVEEQFYLVVPVLMLLISRLKRSLMLPTVLCFAAASFAVAVWQVKIAPVAAFYLLPSRAWELAAGVAIAIAEIEFPRAAEAQRRAAPWLNLCGLALVLAPSALLTRDTPFPGAAALPSVLGAAMLLAASSSWISRKVLGHPALAFIGRISYSWYLIHWPLLALARVCRFDPLPRSEALALVAVSFALAVASYRWIEQPFRRSTRPPAAILLRYAAATAVLLAAGFAGLHGNLRPVGEDPGIQAVDTAAESLKQDKCLIWAQNPIVPSECEPPAGPRGKLVLWGDSHAAMLSEVMAEIAAKNGLSVSRRTMAICPPLLGIGRRDRQKPSTESACAAFNAATLAAIQRDPQVKVVALASYWENAFGLPTDDGRLFAQPATRSAQSLSPEDFEAALQKTVAALTAAGKQVVLFNDGPVFQVLPVARMRASMIPLRLALTRLSLGVAPVDPGADFASSFKDPLLAVRQAVADAGRSTPVQYYDLAAALCDTRGYCRYRIGNDLLMDDADHLSPSGAEISTRALRLQAAP